MSHTIGQIKEGARKSETIQDSLPTEDKTFESVSALSDADYEFLFNQLLEGIAHGWHDRRIVKFFQQLGDRGKQKDWIDWLERLRPKIITLPVQSKRQLGTIMIRLGELTQSAPEVVRIGTTSNRIGRELLFGNMGDIIWEYVGPDSVADTPVMELETQETFSERLPKDFDELGSAKIEDGINELKTESSSQEESILESTAEYIVEEPTDSIDTNLQSETVENEPAVSTTDESTVKPSADNAIAEETDSSEAIGTFNDEFEFELEDRESEPITQDLIQANDETETAESTPSSVSKEKQLSNLRESANNLSSTVENEPTNSPQSELDDSEPVAIDLERVMSLIEQDEDLAHAILQKLNISLNNTGSEESSENLSLNASVDLDRSTIDLIEGWFNLGLKQVSGREFEKAIASWEKALNINPNLSEAWHNRGSALGRLGKYHEAIESFQKALDINPDNYQAWNDRAHALYQMEDWATAAQSWSNAIKITPGNHLFWYNRGCALEQLKSWAESIASYEKSLEIKPDFEPARSRYTNLIADNSHSN